MNAALAPNSKDEIKLHQNRIEETDETDVFPTEVLKTHYVPADKTRKTSASGKFYNKFQNFKKAVR